jgi:hypothetical protein
LGAGHGESSLKKVTGWARTHNGQFDLARCRRAGKARSQELKTQRIANANVAGATSDTDAVPFAVIGAGDE